MALVIVTGLPCSGRTKRSCEIQDAFNARLSETPKISSVVRVSDDDVHVGKQVYETQIMEKSARAAYLSGVRRALNHQTIVIADGGAGLNIKGYRYELWCAARELGIRCLTVSNSRLTKIHTACHPDLCRGWNSQRLQRGSTDSYKPNVLEELIARFEEPTPASRWHRPLFVLTATGKLDAPDFSPTPVDDLWDGATQAEVKAPKAVTAQRHSTSNNSMELLDRITQQVVAAALEQRCFADQGSIPIALNGLTSLQLAIRPGRPFPTPARLQTLRRQFVRLYANKSELQDVGLSHNAPEQKVARLFTAWLQEALA